MNESIRLFTGLSLPPFVRNELSERMKNWRDTIPFSRYVHPSDLHITLHFLGEIPAGKLPLIKKALDEAAAASKPIPLQLSGAGTFGAPSQPSTLWLGLAGPLPELRQLHAALADSLEKNIGYAPEKRAYRPHVTIARKLKAGERWNASLLDNVDGSSLRWTAESACLFQSRLGQSPMYEIIHQSTLS